MLIIKKRIISVFAAAALLASVGAMQACADDTPPVSAVSAVVTDMDGRVLYGKNADAKMPVASTTKLMTALVALENSGLDDEVPIIKKYCEVEGSSMYLKPGEKYTVRELLYGLLLVSGNDAATALACHTAGSEQAFVDMMNSRADELGMDGSSFKNPHGLDEDGHYSNARDMAKLMAACLSNRDFTELCSAKSVDIAGQTLVNHNKLLWKCEGCTAGKTGYTMAAGRCLVSCCKRSGMQLICVTLSDPNDWEDHMRLYNWAFANFTYRNVLANVSFDIPLISASQGTVKIIPADEMKVLLPKNKAVELRAEMPRFVFAPIKMGETAGEICVIIDNELIGSRELVYAESVALEQTGRLTDRKNNV